MTALVIYPDAAYEQAEGGSKEFRREADRFLAFHHLGPESVYRFDAGVPHPDRAPGVLRAIEARQDLELVAILSHGWEKGIQPGFTMRNVGALAQALARASRPTLAVVLYCCSTAGGEMPTDRDAPGGDGGFADALRDALCAAGVTQGHVDGHITVGHCCRNPYARRFFGTGTTAPGKGGRYIVEPKSALWPQWVRALSDTDLRFRFPLMTLNDVQAELMAEARSA